MDPIQSDAQGTPALQAKPCTSCRRRKVKCDKARPCSNCARMSQACTYENADGRDNSSRPEGSSSQSSDNNDLRERLARLEELMATMMVSDNATTLCSPEVASNGSNPPLSHHATRSRSTPTPLPASHSHGSDITSSPLTETTGQIVFQEGFCAYFDADFWPGVIAEVEDLRQIFDADPAADSTSQWASYSAVGFASPFSVAEPSPAHPTIEESNLLCKYFFECVNPFLRILHQGLFARELESYRRETLLYPLEFEALLFCIYALTIGSLRPQIVQKVYSCQKDILLPRFQHSAQTALARINFLQSNKIYALVALLHYITFLFQQNLYREGVALLGSAVHVAQTQATHRDSSHFPFSPWICELRRRWWNHICVLDAIALTSYGAESCLPAISDTQPPKNANDSDWHASRFAKPSSVPMSTVGFKDMTFALVRRELADMSRELSTISCRNLDQKETLVSQVEHQLTHNYLTCIDTSISSQTIVAAFIQVTLASARLSIQHLRFKQSDIDPNRQKVFMSALELLEAYEFHSATYAPLNWEWVFQTTIPWLALAIVLTELPKTTHQSHIERAKLQIETYFQRFSDPSKPISTSPMWKMLVRLRQNMQQGPSAAHVPISGVRDSAGVSPVPGTGAAALAFTDDSMADIGNQGFGGDEIYFNDQLMMQNTEAFPWLGEQMTFSNGAIRGYQIEQQQ